MYYKRVSVRLSVRVTGSRSKPDRVLREVEVKVGTGPDWRTHTVLVPRTPAMAIVLRFGLLSAPNSLEDLQKLVAIMTAEGLIPGREPAPASACQCANGADSEEKKEE